MFNQELYGSSTNSTISQTLSDIQFIQEDKIFSVRKDKKIDSANELKELFRIINIQPQAERDKGTHHQQT